MKESISLSSQKLLFIRRSDLSETDRLTLAIAGLGRAYRRGTIAEYEARYKVSHSFIYQQSKKLKSEIASIFSQAVKAKTGSPLEEVLSSIRFFVEARLETQGPLQGLSNLAKSMGVKYTSTNFISEALQIAGSLVGGTHSTDKILLLTFLSDEIYSGGQAILVTIEAQSMLVLDIRLVEGSLTSSDWESSFSRLASAQIIPKRLIKDQGVQMAAAAKLLPGETIIGVDTFHAIPHRLGLYHSRLKKDLEQAEAKESDRAVRFASTKTYETALKKEVEWEAAKDDRLQAADQLAWFDEHYFKLIQQLRPFTSKGIPRNAATAKKVMKTSLEALRLLEIPKLQKQLNHIDLLLENGELLHFMDQVPILHQQLQPLLEVETTWLWMLYWQWTKKSYQTHSPKVGQRAKEEAKAAQELLQEYYQTKPNSEGINTFETIRKEVFKTLDEIVQASSLVETFNSILKPFINSARGQVSQEMLNLVKFYHNHRVFKRGKRKDFAPIELLSGQALDKSWIDLLMEKIKTAFQKYQVSSLKELHQIICPKNKESDNIRELKNSLIRQLCAA